MQPLADRLRPRTLDELAGQEKLVGPGTPLRVLIERDEIPSLIFWGPPGSGKTTLAKIIANQTGAIFEEMSAVIGGVAEIRRVIEAARVRWEQEHRRTILFVDCHSEIEMSALTQIEMSAPVKLLGYEKILRFVNPRAAF